MFHDGTYDEKISQLNLCYISLLAFDFSFSLSCHLTENYRKRN